MDTEKNHEVGNKNGYVKKKRRRRIFFNSLYNNMRSLCYK